MGHLTSMTTDTGRPLTMTVGAQHATIRALFAEVTDGGQRRERFAELARYLAIHEAAEQTFLGRGHSEQAAMVSRLEQIGPDDPYFLIQLGLLEETAEEHARHAEKNELPALEASLAPDALRDARDGMAQVEVLAEDRAAVPVDGGYAAQRDAALRHLASRTSPPDRRDLS